MNQPQDLVGMTFGRLTVISRGFVYTSPKNIKKPRWNCICLCGGTQLALANHLKSGLVRSCGCLLTEWQKRVGKANSFISSKRRKPGVALRTIFKRYKRNAENKALLFDLSLESFKNLVNQPCFYCGTLKSNTVSVSVEVLEYNGVDRVQNNLGYTEDNCVACCCHCNWAKKGMSQEDFISMCKKVAARFP